MGYSTQVSEESGILSPTTLADSNYTATSTSVSNPNNSASGSHSMDSSIADMDSLNAPTTSTKVGS